LLVLRRFFQDYKQLEGKQVQVEEILPAYAALSVIEKSLARYQLHKEELISGGPAGQNRRKTTANTKVLCPRKRSAGNF
jgi:hypothetical protein